jgi:acyl-CoA thioester hydrolase
VTGREPFSWPVRVYWEDTDAGGVVYHSVYLNYFERTRSEWLRSVGLDQRALHAEERIQFVVVDMNVRWIRPARYDDLLTVTSVPIEVRGASLRFEQVVWRGGEEIARAEVRVAALDAATLKPMRLPAAVLARMQATGAPASAP